MTKKHLAFSLIELSIVILIIGILIAGVTQGSRLIRDSRIKTAKTITQSSDVSSIKNLIAWWETTTSDSFDDSASLENTDSVTTWNDINPQSTIKHDLSGTATYTEKAINGFPALSFDGSSDYFELTSTIQSNELTYFMVMQPDVISALKGLIVKDDWSSNGYTHYSLTSSGDAEVAIYGQTHSGENYPDSTTAVVVNTPTIIALTSDSSNSIHYVNGTQTGSFAVGTLQSPKIISPLKIGAWDSSGTIFRYFDGYIGEILIFNRRLKTSERTNVFDYLSKKWKIKLS